jgi:hypothetical protein
MRRRPIAIGLAEQRFGANPLAVDIAQCSERLAIQWDDWAVHEWHLAYPICR